MNRKVLSSFAMTAVVLAIIGCGGQSASSTSYPYPEKIDQSLLLEEGDDNAIGKVHLVFNDRNGVKFKEEIELPEGYLQIVFYRPEGTVKEELIYFPQTCAGEKRLKSKVVMDRWGADYLWHKVFREDGTVEVSGQRIANWEYATTYYFDDGESIKRQVVYSGSKELKAETTFYENGNPKQNTELVGAAYATTDFREDGTRIQRVVNSDLGVKSAVYYDVDGSTELFRFSNESYNIEVTLYPQDGENISSATIRYTDKGRTYTVFGTDGKARFLQEWKLAEGPSRSDSESTYVLEEVVIFNHKVYSGVYQWTDVTRIRMDKTGLQPVAYTVKKNGSKSLVVVFHPDGSVRLLGQHNEDGKWASEKFAPGMRENPLSFDAEIFKFHKFDTITLPPKMNKPGKK